MLSNTFVLPSYTPEQIEESKIKDTYCIVYDKSKYSSPIDAMMAKDFIDNKNIEVPSFDLYHIYDYRNGINDILSELNKNLVFVWQYYGINVFELHDLHINQDFDSERDLTAEILLENTLQFILNDLKCGINVSGEILMPNDINCYMSDEFMMKDLVGEVDIMGLSIRTWINLLTTTTQNTEKNLLKFVIAEKVILF